MNSSSVFIGIDVGTQGVRVLALDEQGQLLASFSETFHFTNLRQEQSTGVWWGHLVRGLRDVASQLRKQGSLHRLAALSVTSTSGTVIPLNKDYQAINSAIMYSDNRSVSQAQQCKEVARQSGTIAYTNFNTSSGLPKIRWFLDTHPEQADKIRLWAHATDYLTGRLSGQFGLSDYTSVLKTGYDLDFFQWPIYLERTLGIPTESLPKVVPPGTIIGELQADVAEETGLPSKTVVVTGMTDGCASQIAAGAVSPGDWNTTIGTTLVVKGVTEEKILDPAGSFYNHRHPQGYWMPGGASNTGADWIHSLCEDSDLERLNQQARSLTPTNLLTWPLMQSGERFPFVSPNAKGFHPSGLSRELHYTSGLEGVAYIERMAYERIRHLTQKFPTLVYTAGGGSRSEVWMQIRSTVLGVPVVKMRYTEGAVGAAVVAAAGSRFPGIQEAAQHMLRVQTSIDPDESVIAQYDESYAAFVEELKRKGYITRGSESF